MSAARREDESVQTSLRELMQQEEERVRAEAERLEQLRAAKARIDRERAEAAREAEELRERKAREEQAELEAKKSAALERARLEALAKFEADKRAAEIEERVRLASLASSAAPRPKSRFGVGLAAGVFVAVCAASAAWFSLGAPRIAREAKSASAARADLDQERASARDARAADQAALDQARRDGDALRAENDRLRRAIDDAKPRPRPAAVAPVVRARKAPKKSSCLSPLDPLCGDLDVH